MQVLPPVLTIIGTILVALTITKVMDRWYR